MTFTETTRSIVIGGHSGIGAAVARALEARPGQVIRAGRRTGLDISDPTSITAFFAKQEAFDHLVITAGSQAPGGALAALDLIAAKAAFETKFWGTITAIKTAAPSIRPGCTFP